MDADAGFFCTGYGIGRGLGRAGSSTSSRGMEKQKQKVSFGLAFGLGAFGGGALVVGLPLPLPGRLLSCKSMIPNLSARVSRLERSSRMGFVSRRGPGLDCAEWLACSLCCQQYRVSSPRSILRPRPLGDSVAAVARAGVLMGLLHGRPLEVMPLHVEFGFLESARSRRDSGVLATKGMLYLTGGDEARGSCGDLS